MDIGVLNKTLLAAAQEVEGWEQPYHLLALQAASERPELEHLLSSQRVGMLRTLLNLGLRVRRDIRGLILASSMQDRRVVMGILRDGKSSVVLADAVAGVTVLSPHLPRTLGDHDEIVASALRLMDCPTLPRQAAGILAPTG